ncbi:MAG: FxsA family protein [Limnochordia bacterium]|jgi:UPF0716 protein FxsA|nr:FxsA family protein [Bacillota bacterium]
MVYLLLVLVLLPTLELTLLIELGRQVGTWPTIGLVLATGVIGTALAKSQGLAVLYRMAVDLNEGQIPAEGLFDGLLIFVGGLLLATPGLITDTVGFLLLLPGSRKLIKERARAKIYDWIRRGTIYISVR